MKKIITSMLLLVLVGLMSGVANAVPSTVPSVPDAGTTASLMALAFGGLTVLRRFVR